MTKFTVIISIKLKKKRKSKNLKVRKAADHADKVTFKQMEEGSSFMMTTMPKMIKILLKNLTIFLTNSKSLLLEFIYSFFMNDIFILFISIFFLINILS